MSNERDELAEVLRRHRYKREEAVCSCSDLVQVGLRCDSETHEQHAAVAVLDAGYRKPRTITTEDELRALPIGAVVLAESYTHYLDGMRIAFQKWNDEAWHRGGRAGTTHPDNFLPVTVLHEGVSL